MAKASSEVSLSKLKASKIVSPAKIVIGRNFPPQREESHSIDKISIDQSRLLDKYSSIQGSGEETLKSLKQVQTRNSKLPEQREDLSLPLIGA